MRRSCGGYPIAATCSTLTASTSGFKTTPIARSTALSSTNRTLREAQEKLNSWELLRPRLVSNESRFGVEEQKKGKKTRSKEDECIDTRGEKKDGGFGIQPIRRSFSMD
ncbi:hypothetical protein LINPERHAP2_LOCUS37126 [Linum perenne]